MRWGEEEWRALLRAAACRVDKKALWIVGRSRICQGWTASRDESREMKKKNERWREDRRSAQGGCQSGKMQVQEMACPPGRETSSRFGLPAQPASC